MGILKRIRDFIKTEIWYIHLRELPKVKAVLYRIMRIILLTYRGFTSDKCPLRASALTFYSLLSMVPILAMLIAVAKGFGFQKRLELRLLTQFPEHQEVTSKILEFSKSFLESTHTSVVAGLGIILLFWTVIRVLGTIEHSFNDIWKLSQSRTLVRKFTDYLAILLIGPVNFILSSSATILVSTQIRELSNSLGLPILVGSMIEFGLNILPWILIWILFTLIYVIIPNTQVRFKSGMIAGIIAGSIYQITQIIFVQFQLGVAGYNAVYGGFAALPLFLIWLQLSWFIVLFGAELSYAIQFVDNYEFAPLVKSLSASRKRLFSLYITQLTVKTFAEAKEALTISEISSSLKLPMVVVRDIISRLIRSQILSETYSSIKKESTFQPSADISLYTIEYVLHRLDHSGSDYLPSQTGEKLQKLTQALDDFENAVKKSSFNRLLSEL